MTCEGKCTIVLQPKLFYIFLIPTLLLGLAGDVVVIVWIMMDADHLCVNKSTHTTISPVMGILRRVAGNMIRGEMPSNKKRVVGC